MSFRLLSILLGLAIIVPSAFSATINVPVDQPTIQAGINAASNGDTVVIAPGTYSETIDFVGKNLVVTSSAGPDSTTLQRQVGPMANVQFIGGESSSAVLSGFKIVGSTSGYQIYVDNSSPTIRGNFFVGHAGTDQNQASLRVTGTSHPYVARNVFANTASNFIGLWCDTDSVNFVNNTIVGGQRGIAAYAPNSVIRNNIITGCTYYGFWTDNNPMIRDYNDIWGNNSNYYPGLTPDPTDISVDPVFEDAGAGNYRLQATSLCVNAGHPDSLYNDPDGSRSDIGAIPYVRPPMAIHVAVTGNDLTGNGSVVNPYASLSKAVMEAQGGDSILVHEGTYTGDANAGVNPAGKDLIVRGVGGLGTVVIAPNVTSGYPDAALVFNSGETNSTIISNLRFVMEGNVLLSIIADSASPTIDNCEFEQTTGPGTHQQAVILLNSATAISNCSFVNFRRGCSACKDGHQLESAVIFGPALIVQESTDILISDCRFVGNYSDDRGSGGAAWFKNSNVTVSRSSFTQNIVSKSGENSAIYGGGAILSENCVLLIDSSQFYGNQSPDRGGAIEVNGGNVEFQNCRFANNTATFGGAVFAYSSILTIGSSTLDSNRAYDDWHVSGGEGGAVAVSGSQLYFYQSLLYHNSADSSESGERGLGAHVFALNAMIDLEQTAMVFGLKAEAIAVGDTISTVNVACSNLFGNTLGDWVGPTASLQDLGGNLRADPHICEGATTPGSVAENSPLLAANNPCGLDIGLISGVCLSFGKTIHVDPSGVDSVADGSPANPFTTIQTAINASSSLDTIKLASGIYSGPGNYNLRFFGRELTILGNSDPELVQLIPPTDQDKIFEIRDGETDLSSFVGLSLNSGYIELASTYPTFSNVIFDRSHLSADLYTSADTFLFRECTWRNGSIVDLTGNAIVDSSQFDSSLIAFGGYDLDVRQIRHSTFSNCTQAIEAPYSGIPVHVDSCQFEDCGLAIRGPSVSNYSCFLRCDTVIQLYEYKNAILSHCRIDSTRFLVLDQMDYGTSVMLDTCLLRWNAGSFMSVYGATEDPVLTSITRCRIENSSLHGILRRGWLYFSDNVVCNSYGDLSIIGNNYYAPGTSLISGNTFASNDGMTIHIDLLANSVSVTNNVFFENESPVVILEGCDTKAAIVQCNVVYPVGVPIVDAAAATCMDSSSNQSIYPAFCDSYNGNYSLAANSPCLPENNQCGELIGADSLGCDSLIRVIYVNIAGDDSTGDGSELAPYATIQHGIDVSIDGDTVLVGPGIYEGIGNKNIDFGGRNIAVIGSGGRDSTTIDCAADSVKQSAGFIFLHGEDSTALVRGFTIINGDGSSIPFGPIVGGGVTCIESTPRIENLRISNCSPHGVYLEMNDPAPPVHVVDLSVVGAQECGLSTYGTDLIMSGCESKRNEYGLYALYGSVSCDNSSFDSNNVEGYYNHGISAFLENCTLSANGSTGLETQGGDITIVNSEFCNNGAFGFSIDDYGDGFEYKFDQTIFIGNGGAAINGPYALGDSIVVKLSSFYDNNGVCISLASGENAVDCSNTIFAFNSGSVVEIGDTPGSIDFVRLQCCDAFGNESGDWVGPIDSLADLYGNMSLDPLFCDTAAGDFTIYDASPCAPANNSCGTLIGALGVGCTGVPSANNVLLEGEEQLHVLSATPVIAWQFSSPGTFVQDSVELAIGTDTTWQFAEMWNPATFATSDTNITYNGSPLQDGQTYYGRLRVHNGLVWSPWSNFTFRMNSVPGVPVAQSPINQALVGQTPVLTLTSATDAEGDGLTYDFQVFQDTAFVEEGSDVTETPDSTSWSVSVTLVDNTEHWWRARSFDGYEYSAWSAPGYFYVDATPEAPSAATGIYPPAAPDSVITEQMPVFVWSASIDPDPLDTVRYRLITAPDSGFVFQSIVDSITDTTYAWPTELELTQKYWWKVQAFDKSGLSAISATRSFWVGYPGCCVGRTGNVNGDPGDLVNLSDLTVLVNYLFVTFQPIPCKAEANTNGDAACGINLSDVTVLVNYLFVTFQPVANCGDFAESACGGALE